MPKPSEGSIVKPHLFSIYLILLVNAIGYFVLYLLLKNVDSRDSLHRTIDKLVSTTNTTSLNKNIKISNCGQTIITETIIIISIILDPSLLQFARHQHRVGNADGTA